MTLLVKNRIASLLLLLLVALPHIVPSQNVVFSASGGFYEKPFPLTLSCPDESLTIHYTINGNTPTVSDLTYNSPLLLDESLYSQSHIYTIFNCPGEKWFLPDTIQQCIVIRAAAFDALGQRKGKVSTNTYLIQSLGCDTHGLPVVSLCADSLDLFSFSRGIFVPGAWQSSSLPQWTGNYFCKGREWERCCNVEFYELDNRGINQQAGLRTHGGASRRFQQKGLKLYAREEYGKKRFKHHFFDDAPIENVKHLTLKPFRCSNWLQIGLNDALAHRVARRMDMDVLGTRATVMFLNGEYWGIYYLEEATDERYLEDHYDVDPDSCNIIKNWNTLDNGDDAEWQELYDWLEDADVSLPENYDYLCSKIDMHNFIDYLVFELYSANVDWPANNVRCWQAEDRKWRWFFFDGDGCFFRDWDVFANIIDTSDNLGPSNATSTLFYRRLLRNEEFVTALRSRFGELMATRLNYGHTGPVLDALRAEIEDEVPNQSYRFHFPINISRWSADLEVIDAFLRGRNERMNEQIEAFMNVFSDEEMVSFACYPNPFSNEIHISIDADAFGANEIAIYDMLGRKVFAMPLQSENANPIITFNPHLNAGVYVLRIGKLTQKIVKY